MQTLHKMFEYRHPVWAVSHAGHCVPPDSMDMVEDAFSAAEGDVFGLNGQIEHKLSFLRQHVPRGTSLVLVGHSIGCYIILNMMKRNPELKIIKAIALFPTIERMAQTPQGKVMTPVLCHMRYVAYLPLFLLSLLPEELKASLIKLVFGSIRSLDHTVVQPTVGLLSGDCAGPRVWRKRGEAQNPRCLKSSVKFPQSVMVWGAMSSAGVGPLCFLRSRVNAAVYQEVLEHFMLPAADQLYGDADFIFQQDLAPAHSAKATSTWFKDHGIPVLNGPANSPDLNPIENLWT
ncbi:lipid droplet-associated hydrolase isoform X3 [Sander vitreus]